MFVIAGAGIIGLTIARELLLKGEKVLVLEKEKDVGFHASGMNSGVLHAGFYYSPESLKAKLCAEGNRLMREYIKNKNLKILECGKVVVASEEKELELLQTLYERGIKNGVEIKIVDEKELKKIEPCAKTVKYAIFSPNTAVVDPKEILLSLKEEIASLGGEILFSTKVLDIEPNNVITTSGKFKYDFFINATGVWSDKIAEKCGIKKYKILPFIGKYWRLKRGEISRNIYPVPDMRFPFLGVHFTKNFSEVFVGPTASISLGREKNKINTKSIEIILNFLKVFKIEYIKYIKYLSSKEVKKQAQKLVNFEVEIEKSKKFGIRAQLVEGKNLVMDFVIEKVDKTLHILNAVSPAFTSSFAFAKFLEKYIN